MRQLRRKMMFSRDENEKKNLEKELEKVKNEEERIKIEKEVKYLFEKEAKIKEEENLKKMVEKIQYENRIKREEAERIKREEEAKRIKEEYKNNNNNNKRSVYTYLTNNNNMEIPEKIKSGNVNIVIAHYKEDLSWIKNLQYPYIVVSRAGLKKEEIPNKGYEASSYLEYIINNYDNLNEYTLFLHAHRNSWHHKSNIDESVNKLLFNKPYYNINELKIDKIMIGSEQFRQILEKNCNIKYDRINKHKYRPAAQFYVHKSLILRNPKSFYQTLYDFLMASNDGSYSTSRYFEYSWHIIFTHNNDDVE